MGLFDAVSDAVKSVGKAVSGGSSGDNSILGSVFDVGSTVAGAYLQTQANKSAAKDIKKAEQERNDLIRQANQQAQQQYADYQARAEPANVYLRRLIATEGGGLTPGQTQELQDVRRSTRNQLASSGLRGSGRATTAALRNVEADTLGRFTEENRTRAQQAANVLGGQGFQATNAGVNAGFNTAQQTGEGLRSIGVTQGSSDIANARLQGQALGDISALIASDIKDRTRKSKYD